jgi:hypothetical protein
MYQILETREMLTGFRSADLKLWFHFGDIGPNNGILWTNLRETGCGDVECIRLQRSYEKNSNESPHHSISLHSCASSITLPPHFHYFWLDFLFYNGVWLRAPNRRTDPPLVVNLIPTAPENSLADWTIAEEWKQSLVLVNIRFHKTRGIS